MKIITLTLTLTILLTGAQVFASAVAEEFITDFVNQANHRLQITNKERTAAKKRTNYCASLDSYQVKKIKRIITNNPNITIGEFALQLSDTLKCFPEFWAPWDRKTTTGGILLNTKAYLMDMDLVYDVLGDLYKERPLNDDRKLLDSYYR